MLKEQSEETLHPRAAEWAFQNRWFGLRTERALAIDELKKEGYDTTSAE